MYMNPIPVTIRPHLIPFLFNEMEGEQSATTEVKKAKLIKITKSSSLGLLLIILQERITPDYDLEKITGHTLFLSVEKNNKGNKATLFRKVNHTGYEIQLLPADVVFFNEFLENIYRTSLIAYISGYSSSGGEKQVRQAIHQFMLKHDLYDYNIDPESMRREYYRAQKKNMILHRFQFRNSNNQTVFI